MSITFNWRRSKFNCSKCCVVIKTILEKASVPNFYVFWDREAFPKPVQFSQWKKLVVSGCAGFPSRDELGVGGGGAGETTVPVRRGGAAYNSSSRKVLLTTPPLSGWWCSTGTMEMDIPSFFSQRWCCVFPSPSVGSCCFPPSSLGWSRILTGWCCLTPPLSRVVVVSSHTHIYIDQCLFDKRLKKMRWESPKGGG